MMEVFRQNLKQSSLIHILRLPLLACDRCEFAMLTRGPLDFTLGQT